MHFPKPAENGRDAALGVKNPPHRSLNRLGSRAHYRLRAFVPRLLPNGAVHLAAMNDNEIMTGAQVAELLQISVRTLEDWRLTQTGPPYRKMGKHVRYLRSEVLAWFEGLSVHA